MKSKRLVVGVIGLGRFGRSVAENLVKLGHEVICLDSDAVATQTVSAFIDHVITADATKVQVLREIGIQHCDSVVIAIGSNVEASIMATLLVKEMEIPHIIAKANDDLHAKVLRKIGVETVIQPEGDLGERVAFQLVTNHIVDLIHVSTGICLVELRAPANFVGNSLETIKLRDRYRVSLAAIKRKDTMLVPPTSHEIIQENDLLFLFGTEVAIANLRF